MPTDSHPQFIRVDECQSATVQHEETPNNKEAEA
jgi:hypothetical protein